MRVLRIEANNTLTKVLFYIDGNLVATHTTGIPTPATRLGYWTGVTPSTAAAVTMDIDYIKFWSDDPDTHISSIDSLFKPTVIDFMSLTGASALPDIVWNSRSVLQDLNYAFDRSTPSKDTGYTLPINTLSDTGTIDDYALYAANTMRRSIEKLSGTHIDTDLSVRSLDTDKVKLDRLCFGENCIDSGSLVTRTMLDTLSQTPANILQSITNNYTIVQSGSSDNSTRYLDQSGSVDYSKLLNGTG